MVPQIHVLICCLTACYRNTKNAFASSSFFQFTLYPAAQKVPLWSLNGRETSIKQMIDDDLPSTCKTTEIQSLLHLLSISLHFHIQLPFYFTFFLKIIVTSYKGNLRACYISTREVRAKQLMNCEFTLSLLYNVSPMLIYHQFISV